MHCKILVFLLTSIVHCFGKNIYLQALFIDLFTEEIQKTIPNISAEVVRSIKVSRFYDLSFVLRSEIKKILSKSKAYDTSQLLAMASGVFYFFYKLWKLSEIVDDVKVENICEIGFNQGLSSLNFLVSNPKARIISFDTVDDLLTTAALQLLHEIFPKRQLLFIPGDSARTIPQTSSFLVERGLCNIVFLYGGKSHESLLNDLKNIATIVNMTYHRIIIDKIEMKHKAELWQEFLASNIAVTREIVHSTKYDCIFWNDDESGNGFNFDFGNHDESCAKHHESSTMVIGSFVFENSSFYSTSLKGRNRVRFDLHFVLYYVGDNDKSNELLYNGNLIRQRSVNTGVSGTDSAAVLTLETLVRSLSLTRFKRSMFFYFSSHAFDGSFYNGVHYISRVNSSIAAKITILILPSYAPEVFQFYEKFTSLSHFVFVGHTERLIAPYITLSAIKQRINPKFHFIHLSNWAKEYSRVNSDFRSWNFFEDHAIIPNPIFWDLIMSYDVQQLNSTRLHWVFHSRYERGGALAGNIFCKLNTHNNFQLRYLDYYTPENKIFGEWPCEGIKFVGSASKPDLYGMLSESKYFLYLLVFSSGYVHKDMCPTAVIEAILLGVRVVTLPVGSLTALFGEQNLVDFIPVVNKSLDADLSGYRNDVFAKELLGNSFVDHVTSFIKKLDDEDFSKERLRRIKVASNLFSYKRFRNLWMKEIFEP